MTERRDGNDPGDELVQLFWTAQELPEDQRFELIQRLSLRDREMAHRLAILLAADQDRTDPKFSALCDLMAQQPINIGEVVGDYRITRCLSHGGTAVVYLAEHASIPRKRVALKVQHAFLLHDGEASHSLFQEGYTAQLLAHPGIVKVDTFGYLTTGQAYLMMAFLEGGSLGHCIREHGRLPQARALALMAQLAGAVAQIHARGIVHRDLKPENIMLVPSDEPPGERPVVLDFGIAMHTEPYAPCTGASALDPARTAADISITCESRASASCAHSSLLGTPLYMAPEQFMCPQSVDHRADLYSLGCILYAMLCGQPPFTGTMENIARGHREATPPSLVAWAVDRSLESLIMQTLAKDPAARPQSAEQFIESLAMIRVSTTRGRATAATCPKPSRPRRASPRAISSSPV